MSKKAGKWVEVLTSIKDLKPEDFRDDLSRKEFAISRMCQTCQDDTFGEDA